MALPERDKNVMTTTKKRTKAKKLPKTKKDLTPAQAKRVKGGTTPGAMQVTMGDGSVRVVEAEKHLLKYK